MKSIILRGAAAACLAAVVASSASAQVVGWGPAFSKAGLEAGKCKAFEVVKDRQLPGPLKGIPTELLDEIPFEVPVFGAPKICSIRTPAGLMLISAIYLDKATLKTGQALQIAQEKLVPENRRVQLLIAELLSSQAGMSDPRGAMSEDRAKISAGYVKAADEIVLALEEIQASGAPLSPEAVDALIEAAGLFEEASAYQVQAMIGLQRTTQYVAARGATTAFQRLPKPFYEKFPERAQSVFGNFEKLGRVQAAINGLNDPKLVKNMKKRRDKAEDEAKKQVEKDVKVADKSAETAIW